MIDGQLRLIVCIIFALSMGAAALGAEVIILRSGIALKGHILGQSGDRIYVRTGKKTRTIRKSQLRKIQYVPLTTLQKRKHRAAIRRRYAAWRARRNRIRTARIAAAERKRRMRKLEANILAEKRKQAAMRARRAAALRELVRKKKMSRPTDEPISYWDFAWRSLVLPGWGHFKLNRPIIGSVYVVTTVGLLGAAYSRRTRAASAVRTNRSAVERNFLLTLQPQLAPLAVRLTYAYYANARAFVTYQKKIDRYHGALYSLGVFYGVQLLHIIYNGIAWENGKLIVNNEVPQFGGGATPEFAIGPDVVMPGRAVRVASGQGRSVRLGLRWSF